MRDTNFNTGDEVIALSSTIKKDRYDECQERVQGQLYIVSSVRLCMACNDVLLNLVGDTVATTPILQCECGARAHTAGLLWTSGHEFIKATPTEIQKEIQYRIKIEDYEFASVLRDIKNGLKEKSPII